MKNSNIGWTTHSWNPVIGCSKVSPGCDNCYAEALAERFRGTPGYPNGFDVTLKPHQLVRPLNWPEPAHIFVNSLSDVFHREIPDEYLVEIWRVMVAAGWHTFQVLTKRPHRMAAAIARLGLSLDPHIWLGVSVESQRVVDSRLPALVAVNTPSRFVSAEPLLSRISLKPWIPDLGWVIAGGESGAQRRPFKRDWARLLRDECADAGIPFFYKQGSAFRPGQDRDLDGRTWDRVPGTID